MSVSVLTVNAVIAGGAFVVAVGAGCLALLAHRRAREAKDVADDAIVMMLKEPDVATGPETTKMHSQPTVPEIEPFTRDRLWCDPDTCDPEFYH